MRSLHGPNSQNHLRFELTFYSNLKQNLSQCFILLDQSFTMQSQISCRVHVSIPFIDHTCKLLRSPGYAFFHSFIELNFLGSLATSQFQFRSIYSCKLWLKDYFSFAFLHQPFSNKIDSALQIQHSLFSAFLRKSISRLS